MKILKKEKVKQIDIDIIIKKLKKIIRKAKVPINGYISRMEVPFSVDHLTYEIRTRIGRQKRVHSIKKVMGIDIVGNAEKLKIIYGEK